MKVSLRSWSPVSNTNWPEIGYLVFGINFSRKCSHNYSIVIINKNRNHLSTNKPTLFTICHQRKIQCQSRGYHSARDRSNLHTTIWRIANRRECSCGHCVGEYCKFPSRRHDRSNVDRHFTPSWFAVIMGTGITAALIASCPLKFNGQIVIASIIFALNVVLFLLFSALTIARYIMFPYVFKKMILHPVQSLYVGCLPMGFATLINCVWLPTNPTVNAHPADCIHRHSYISEPMDRAMGNVVGRCIHGRLFCFCDTHCHVRWTRRDNWSWRL